MTKLIYVFLVFAELVCINENKIHAQNWQLIEEIIMPKAVTNAAVSEGMNNDTSCVYIFGGLDSTKNYAGIHRHSYKFNIETKKWYQLPDLPDNMGKIASAANYHKGIIYIFGGYYVFANGSEKSSNLVHRFDCKTNTFLPNGKDIPIAIDDHVQAMWRDSLIYLITGWNNTTNVANVQIYNPSKDVWLAGTSTPNNNTYKSFGASGIILGDTIFYMGGASSTSGFPIQNTLRKGIINKENPADIVWSSSIGEKTYRAVATTNYGRISWLGGSDITYNYDGIAYNGSGGVDPSSKIKTYDINIGQLKTNEENFLPMDLRGIASFNEEIKYIAGGMTSGQKVSNLLLRIGGESIIPASKETSISAFEIYPNPSHGNITIQPTSTYFGPYDIQIFNINGDMIHNTISIGKATINLLSKGMHIIKILKNNKVLYVQNNVNF